MENWRRNQRNLDQLNEASRRFPQNKLRPNRLPQSHQGNWQRTVPSWEKTFCKVVGSLDWNEIVDQKKFAFMFDNVMKWDSSACEEVFINAKNRFWAELRGIPCNIPLPNPDEYIDEPNWDSKDEIDVQMYLDAKLDPNPDEKRNPVIIFGDALIPEGVSERGWGEEDNRRKATESSLKNHEEAMGPGGWGFQTEYGGVRFVDDGWNNPGDSNQHNLGSCYTGWGGDGWNNPGDSNQHNLESRYAGWGPHWNNPGTGWDNSGDSNYVYHPWPWGDSRNWNYNYPRENYSKQDTGYTGSYNNKRGNRGNTGFYVPKHNNNTSNFSSNYNQRNRNDQRNTSYRWQEKRSNATANDIGAWRKPMV